MHPPGGSIHKIYELVSLREDIRQNTPFVRQNTPFIRVGGAQFISAPPGPQFIKSMNWRPSGGHTAKYAFHPPKIRVRGGAQFISAPPPGGSIHKIYELVSLRRTYGKIRLSSGKIRLSSGLGGAQFISAPPGASIHKIYELASFRRTYGKIRLSSG